MSILIKGMEMPTSCRDCDFMNWGAVEPNRCGITDCFIGGDYDKRHDNCPLVPVPPHGDLIDRDALAEDGWVLTKQVMRMGGYAIHELPLKNPTIPVIIPAEEGE